MFPRIPSWVINTLLVFAGIGVLASIIGIVSLIVYVISHLKWQ